MRKRIAINLCLLLTIITLLISFSSSLSCPVGYGPTEEGKCARCPGNLYSFGGTMECTECPNKGTTCKNGILIVQADYWREKTDTASVHYCKPYTCAGEDKCVYPHAGAVCHGCEKTYFKFGARCYNCGSSWVLILMLIPAAIVIVVYGVLVFLASEWNSNQLHTFTFYAQCFFLILDTKRHDLSILSAPFIDRLLFCLNGNPFLLQLERNLIPPLVLIVALIVLVIKFLILSAEKLKTRAFTPAKFARQAIHCFYLTFLCHLLPVLTGNFQYFSYFLHDGDLRMFIDISKSLISFEYLIFIIVPVLSTIAYIIFSIIIIGGIFKSFILRFLKWLRLKASKKTEIPLEEKQGLIADKKLTMKAQTLGTFLGANKADLEDEKNDFSVFYREHEKFANDFLDFDFILKQHRTYAFFFPTVEIILRFTLAFVIALFSSANSDYDHYKVFICLIILIFYWVIFYMIEPYVGASFSNLAVPLLLIVVFLLYEFSEDEQNIYLRLLFDIPAIAIFLLGFLSFIIQYVLFLIGYFQKHRNFFSFKSKVNPL